MTFAEFNREFQKHFEDMSRDVNRLYEVNVDKDVLWNLYLDSFPAGSNKIFRKRREFDCSCCRHFIRTFGNVVTIKNGVLTTVWDFNTGDDVYQPVVDTLSAFIKAHDVTDVYYNNLRRIGTPVNYEQCEDGTIMTWEHFHIDLPSKFIARSDISAGDFKGRHRDIRNVFKRSLDEISIDALDTVLELIASNSLYRGEEWKVPLTDFRAYKVAYDKLPYDIIHNNARELYAWEKSEDIGATIGKIRNHSIGVLLIDISEGMNLEQAVRRYERIVAPSNYKRPKAIFTQKMLEEAQKKVLELGYMDSLPRRHATLNDISVNNILFCNRDVLNKVQGGDVFTDMMSDVKKKHTNFDRVEEISFDKFVKDILPTAREIEVYLENKHSKNMVSLIAPQNLEAPSMFKWNNNFGWAYSGNVTDSLKENVKAAGGKVNGQLRFSIQWNDGDDWNPNDFDAHCVHSSDHRVLFNPMVFDRDIHTSGHIFFADKVDYVTGGNLDVDIQHPGRNQVAVENIIWPRNCRMQKGNYEFFVRNYKHNGGRSGFKAEIEFDGQIHSFEYPNELREKETVRVATVHRDKDGRFSITELLNGTQTSREIWNLQTNNFIPVSVMMYSPNYWDEQEGNGHRHRFFMLKGCRNPEEPNGFYNEFLKNDLMAHKRVFEALGGRMKVANTDDQLSGIGFSTTKRDEVVVRVTGTAIKRVMKVKF